MEREQERLLVEKMHGPDPEEAMNARDALVKEHLPLAYYVAKRYLFKAPHIPLEDLQQSAIMGLYRAIKTYNPEKAKFITYAYYWVDVECRKTVASYTGLNASKMHGAHFVPIMTHDERQEEEMSMHMIVDDNGRKQIEKQEIISLIQEAVKQLSPLEQHIVELHYYEGWTVKDTALSLNIPYGSMRTYLKAIENKLRRYLTGSNLAFINQKTSLSAVKCFKPGDDTDTHDIEEDEKTADFEVEY